VIRARDYNLKSLYIKKILEKVTFLRKHPLPKNWYLSFFIIFKRLLRFKYFKHPKRNVTLVNLEFGLR